MKIAILLTGQLRTWKLCKELLKKQLLDHYDCDIFMSIDKSNKLQNSNKNNMLDTPIEEITEAIEFYKPISVFYNDITDYSLLSKFPTHFKIYDFNDNNKEDIGYYFTDNNEFKFNKHRSIPDNCNEVIIPVEEMTQRKKKA